MRANTFSRNTVTTDYEAVVPATFTNAHGDYYDVMFELIRDSHGMNVVNMLAAEEGTGDWDLWAFLSVGLDAELGDADNGFIFDSNNVDNHTRQWLTDNGFIVFPDEGVSVASGYCVYPEARMTPKLYAHAYKS